METRSHSFTPLLSSDSAAFPPPLFPFPHLQVRHADDDVQDRGAASGVESPTQLRTQPAVDSMARRRHFMRPGGPGKARRRRLQDPQDPSRTHGLAVREQPSVTRTTAFPANRIRFGGGEIEGGGGNRFNLIRHFKVHMKTAV